MTRRPPVSPESLPASLVDVAEALGVDVALALMDLYGGQDIQIPRRPRADHPVIKALGAEVGYALCHYLGGGRIYVPHGRQRRSARRDVLTLQAAGRTRREIAILLGFSERHIRRMANQAASADPAQLPLWGTGED
ncbi:hypothetical protein P7L78_09125 [Tistrella bauzanensis]|uniref:hypothetical protein n=1 Tax=Tistrella TaxID=171436 RepID=UPI0031F68D99